MKNNIIARCPYCNSIWVCWNWIHCDLEKLIVLNPHMTREELKDTQWGHECWHCGDDWGGSCWETKDKVINGVPYWFLKYIYGLPDIVRYFWYKIFMWRKDEK